MAVTYTNGVSAPAPGDPIPADGASAWQQVASSADAAIGNRYTKAETDTRLAGKSAVGHTHDDRYYTETEVDSKLAGKVDTTDTRLEGTWDNPIDLGTQHLDTITTPGFYTQIYASRATAANGYPVERQAGILEVKNWNGPNGYVVQVYTPWQSNAMSKRTKYSSGFQTWYGVDGAPIGTKYATTTELSDLSTKVDGKADAAVTVTDTDVDSAYTAYMAEMGA